MVADEHHEKGRLLGEVVARDQTPRQVGQAEVRRAGAQREHRRWGRHHVPPRLCSGVGFLVADWLGDVNGARLAAFTIGGLITMLTTSMIPFAYEKGGLSAGIWAVVGFGVTLASS
jgi:ZIP family zinc transporter